MRTVAGIGALCLLLFLSCADQKLGDIPEGPDMEPRLEEYELPSAPLNADNVAEAVEQGLAAFETVTGTNSLTPVMQAVFGMGEGEEGQEETVRSELEVRRQGVAVGDQTVEGDGYIDLTRVCAGWEGPGVVDAELNGQVDLTIVFSDQGFDPVIWGEATDCKYLVVLDDGKEYKVRLDGSVSVHTGTLLSEPEERPAKALIEFGGTLEVDGQVNEAKFHFRLVLGEKEEEVDLEVSVEVNGGNLVFYYKSIGVNGFRGSNGLWTCNLEEKKCESDGQVVGW